MLSLPGLLAEPMNNLHGVPLVVPGMFDSETVAFVSGECDASSMKVAFFHRFSPAPAASCAEIVLFPVPGLCDSEIWHFLVARRAFVTCFRRVTIDVAGICKEKLEIVTCFVRHKKMQMPGKRS